MFFKKDSKGNIADLSDIALIPYLDKETNNIIGTQLLVRRDEKNETKTYIFENKVLEDFYAPKNLIISSQGYKIYRNEYNGDYEAVLAFVNFSKKILNDTNTKLTIAEKNEILTSTIKTICNTIIYDPLCPIPDLNDIQDVDMIKKMKLGRPMEMFDWFSVPMIRKGNMKQFKDMLDKININE